MNHIKKHTHFLLLLLFAACKKEYVPQVILAPNNYLVIDGFINTAPGSVSTFQLSRTRNLTDTVVFIPEEGALVTIESGSGNAYTLFSTGNGLYSSAPLTLSPAGEYRLRVTTADLHQYESDFVPVKNTPAIDSITWVQNNDLELFVHARDPGNNTRYYRWDFVETWQYQAPFKTDWRAINGFIVAADATTQTFTCWANQRSTGILLGNTTALSEDVVSRQLIHRIVKDDEKLSIRYSMLLNQYAITEDAWKYWLIIQRNSQQVGTLFDLQPSQLKGNISSTTHPTEPVIGFVSACNAVQKRIFISNLELNNWQGPVTGVGCNTVELPYDPLNFGPYTYPDPTYAPYYFTAQGYILVVAKKDCIDCRLKGGDNIKPSFW